MGQTCAPVRRWTGRMRSPSGHSSTFHLPPISRSGGVNVWGGRSHSFSFHSAGCLPAGSNEMDPPPWRSGSEELAWFQDQGTSCSSQGGESDATGEWTRD
jgi:hypothetical protein